MSTSLTEIESKTIDTLRPLLSLMVVGLHVRPYFIDENALFVNSLYDASVITIFKVLFSLAVPAFFLISGYLFFRHLEEWNYSIWKDKLKKRLKTLFIPYLLWNLIAFLGFFITRKAGQIIKGNSPVDIITLIHERGGLRLLWDRCLYGDLHSYNINHFGFTVIGGTPMNEPTWFLRDLMVVILFTPLIHFLIRKTGRLFILITGILFCIDLWIPVSGFSSKAFFMFSLGAWFSINGKTMLDSFKRFSITEYSLSILLLFATSISFNVNEWVYCVASRLFIICGVPALFCMVSDFLSEKKDNNLCLKPEFVNSSFFIYLIHTVLITDATCWALQTLIQPNNKAILLILLFASTIAVYLICLLIWIFMNRFMPRTLCCLTGNRSYDHQR